MPNAVGLRVPYSSTSAALLGRAGVGLGLGTGLCVRVGVALAAAEGPDAVAPPSGRSGPGGVCSPRGAHAAAARLTLAASSARRGTGTGY
ncbi:hypothetical protein [uncultured Tessaracoccus sp.]|uniref:hypothetical protein n=1 Tax=uncultured Tessaracoccus sp. TaxID=905023 RepID=UPI0025FAD3EA|nr:hypothetical protein [uncultured Tessaracoccus sp.]